MISDERIWELAREHDTSKGTPVGNAVIAIRQALEEDRESIIRMIDPTGKVFPQDMCTTCKVEYRQELTNKLREIL